MHICMTDIEWIAISQSICSVFCCRLFALFAKIDEVRRHKIGVYRHHLSGTCVVIVLPQAKLQKNAREGLVFFLGSSDNTTLSSVTPFSTTNARNTKKWHVAQLCRTAFLEFPMTNYQIDMRVCDRGVQCKSPGLTALQRLCTATCLLLTLPAYVRYTGV
ncbi:hypothetical protein BD289DRAFT_430883 [Coniella lustricola]|uniref:Uncharacterized protein n=1 Tax=Coniella lustricola TaxID=2025994 RepID=A0A2T3ABG7_9PEZI|nr:hypothetical protein BD289DRAFT_430883 [Coniella lustricola]